MSQLAANKKKAVEGEGTRRRNLWVSAAPYLLLLPAFILLGVVLVYPMLATTYMSFFKWPYLDPTRVRFIGLDNYIELFTEDKTFMNSLLFVLRFTFVAIAIEFFLGLGTALLLDRLKSFRNAIASIIILPYMVAPITVGLIWRLLWAHDFGLVNYVLRLLNLPPVNWLAETDPAFWAITISEVWRMTPFVILILLAGLNTIPGEVYEASRIDGGSAWQIFRHITFPLLLPSIAIALVFETIFKLRIFDLVFTLTGGGPGRSTAPLGLLIQNIYFRDFDGGYAGAMSVVLLLLGAALSWVYVKLVYREVEY